MHLGLVPMIEDVVQRAARSRDSQKPGLGTRSSGLGKAEKPGIDDEIAIGRMLSAIEDGIYSEAELENLRTTWASASPESRVPTERSEGVGRAAAVDRKSTRLNSSH